MALMKHAASLFFMGMAEKPYFMGKRFSKSLCHGADIIGLGQDHDLI